jgi:putative PIN family toxin of toxin-antitoxin system
MTYVIDTNILVAGLKNNAGASYQILNDIIDGEMDVVISVPLFFEYEDVLKRDKMVSLSHQEIDEILNVFCARARHTFIDILWRPQLNDAKDEMVLETAVNGQADTIITFNSKDFNVSEKQSFLKYRYFYHEVHEDIEVFSSLSSCASW